VSSGATPSYLVLQTYNVNSVLNKHLGPMHCYVVEKTEDKNLKISFKLEELDSSSWKK
jgi:hypothetical protein